MLSKIRFICYLTFFLSIISTAVHANELDADLKVQDTSAIYSIAIHPTTPDIIYATSTSGLYQTKDGGDTWRKIAVATYARPVVLNSLHPNHVYFGDRYGFHLSEDSGNIWTSTGLNSIGHITVNNVYPNVIYTAVINHGDTGAGEKTPSLWRSGD